MLNSFVKKFIDFNLNFIKLDNKYYLKNDELSKKKLDIKENIFGLYLGEEKKGEFYPSFGLLDILSKYSNEKLFVNNLGEIDFLYGKDLRKRHVDRIYGENISGIFKLVQNKYNENLGYGILVKETKKSTKILKHISDRGIFLKRDKNIIKY